MQFHPVSFANALIRFVVATDLATPFFQPRLSTR